MTDIDRDGPPDHAELTDYDRRHLKAYLRLLDAQAAGASWEDAAAVVLGLDVAADPIGARRIHARHLARAHWMTEHGYRDLLKPPKG